MGTDFFMIDIHIGELYEYSILYVCFQIVNKMAKIESSEENELTVPRFTIDSEITRQYRRFNAVGTELTVLLLPPAVGDDSDAVSHF